MKNLVLFAVILTIGISYGQQDQNSNKLKLEKGIWFLGGNLSFNISNLENERDSGTGDNDRYNFNINAKSGHFVSDNLLLGLGIGYGYGLSESSSRPLEGDNENSEFNNQTLSLFPFVRGFKAISSKLALYLEGEIRYSRFWSENSSNDVLFQESDGSSWFIGFRPGITYFVSKKLALEANIGNIGYSYSENETQDFDTEGFDNSFESKSNSFSASLNPSEIFFGLSYYF